MHSKVSMGHGDISVQSHLREAIGTVRVGSAAGCSKASSKAPSKASIHLKIWFFIDSHSVTTLVTTAPHRTCSI